MNLRSINLISTDLDPNILEIVANNNKPLNPKNFNKAMTNIRKAAEREGISYAKPRRRGDKLFLVLSESAESKLPKRGGGFGKKKYKSKILTKKIVNAKVTG